MERFLGRYSTYLYAVLRIASGFMFFWHGSQKLLDFPARPAPPGGQTTPPSLDPWSAIGGGIELIGGLLIMIGLFTSVSAFLASGMMAIAYWFWHFSPSALLPIQNRGELAALYCFVFLYIAARGSGVWSVESLFKGTSPQAD